MSEINQLLQKSERILITSHVGPDTDAIASVLAFYDYVSKSFPEKHAEIYISSVNEYIQYKQLKHYEQIHWVEDIVNHIASFDTLVFLDSNIFARFTRFPEQLDLEDKQTICIDHHPNDYDEFDLLILDTSASSCSQLIYEQLFRGNDKIIDAAVCELMMVGILGDSGNFGYLSYKYSRTFVVAEELIRLGELDLQLIHAKLGGIPETQLEIIKQLLNNLQQVNIEGKPGFSYSYLPLSVLKAHDSATIKAAGDFFKAVFLRKVTGYGWGFTVTPDSENILSISFRSTPNNPNVSLIAKALGGGGHILAAGAELNLTAEKQIDSQEYCEELIEFIRGLDLELV